MCKLVSSIGRLTGEKMRNRHKFHATPTLRKGIRFDSKLEARYFDQLLLRQRAGHVVFHLRQVPFHLPGGVTYRCDFAEFRSDGTVAFVDVKGVETKEFIRAKKQVEDLYPVEIEVVKHV